MESVVVWSSMSSVTVVPTAAARSQIRAALSAAIFSPSAGKACPTADSFTETSAAALRPASDRSVSSRRYASVVRVD